MSERRWQAARVFGNVEWSWFRMKVASGCLCVLSMLLLTCSVVLGSADTVRFQINGLRWWSPPTVSKSYTTTPAVWLVYDRVCSASKSFCLSLFFSDELNVADVLTCSVLLGSAVTFRFQISRLRWWSLSCPPKPANPILVYALQARAAACLCFILIY
jgi:hypothetical protein